MELKLLTRVNNYFIIPMKWWACHNRTEGKQTFTYYGAGAELKILIPLLQRKRYGEILELYGFDTPIIAWE